MRSLPLLETYLLSASTLFYILGIAFSPLISETRIILLVLALFFALTLGSLRYRRQLSAYLLLPLFLLAGLYSGSMALRPPSPTDHVFALAHQQTQERIVLGTVRRIYSYDGEVVRFDVDALSQKSRGGQYMQTRGRIRYTLKDRLPEDIEPGTAVMVRAKVKRPNRFATPGSFDYPAYLAAKDIYAIGFIDSKLHIVTASSSAPFLQALKYMPERMRYRIARFLEIHLHPVQAALYQALLTGDRSAVPAGVLENFKSTGVLHILAISGMHMSLLGVFLFAIFFWLLRRSEYLILRIDTKKWAAVLCVLPLFSYALIAGAQTPVLRSFIMSLIVILALCGGTRHTFSTLLASAALLLLAISPLQLFTPSFQLSFAAIISINAVLPLLKRVTALLKSGIANSIAARICIWMVAAMTISLAATLGTAPLLIYHFNRISLVGILTNLIVEPLICLWTLSLGFIAVPFMTIFPAIAEFLLRAGGLGLDLAMEVIAFFASWPHASLHLPTPSLILIAVYYCCFCALFCRNPLSKPQRSVVATMVLCTIFFMVLPPAELTKRFRRASEISYLDVGHGSCSLIQMPGGRRALIDGGALSSPEFDVGERVIAPFLYTQGIRRIDDIVITHPDSDHYNGIAAILRHFKVETLWLSVLDHAVENWQELVATARSMGIKVIIPTAEEVVFDHGRGSLDIVANTTRLMSGKSNDQGLVVRYRHGETGALFAGDISAAIEDELVAAGVDLRANILLAVHHGSASSNSQKLLNSVQPEFMVVSSSSTLPFSFPSSEVIDRCKKQGIRVLSIAETGTVTVTIAEEDYRIKTFSATGGYSGNSEGRYLP